MRSKIAQRIIDQTPEEICRKVHEYGDRIVMRKKVIAILLPIGITLYIVGVIAFITLLTLIK
jgi:hypothetical protein